MRHATSEALDQLEPLLATLRDVEGLVEKKRGTFYRKGKAQLHFHEDPTGLYADVKVDGEWQRLRATTAAEQRAVRQAVLRAVTLP